MSDEKWCPFAQVVDHEGHTYNRFWRSDRLFPHGAECIKEKCAAWVEGMKGVGEETKPMKSETALNEREFIIRKGRCGLIK